MLSRWCKRRRWHWWSIAAILCATGCPTQNSYQVELRITDEGFVHTVDVASQPRPESETDAPAGPFINKDERQVFNAIDGPGQRGSESEWFDGTFSAHAQCCLTWRGFDELTLVLHTAAGPLETNGRRDAESGSVRWQTRLPRRSALPDATSLPQVAFAQWVQVDQSRQVALFGQVLIRDAMLRDYCLWRQRPGEPQAARWQTLLEQLPDRAAEEQIAKLTEFKQQWSEVFDTTPSSIDTLINGLAALSEN